MKPLELFIDTGGTFTDCILRDSQGNEKNFKVLSNGALRGTIIRWVNETEIKIKESWSLTKDIIQGYQFRILGFDHNPVSVVSHNIQEKTIIISCPVLNSKKQSG